MKSIIDSNRWVTIYLGISIATMFWLFQKFLFPILISVLMVLICSGFSSKLESKISRYKAFNNYKTLISAGLITLLIVILMIIPLIALFSYVFNKINYQDLINIKNQLISGFTNITWINSNIKQKLINEFQSNFSDQDNYKKSVMLIFNSMQQISTSTLELTMSIVFFFLILWKRYFLAKFIESLNPISDVMLRKITKEVSSTLQIIFFSLLGLAIAQGLAFAGLMLFYNYNALVLGFAAGVCSMVPIFGTALVWIPVAIIEFSRGNIIGALIIVIFGWLVMAVIIDNFLRIILIKKIANSLQHDKPVNEFLLFFAIAGGLSQVGFWGIILGPALVALFLALSNLYIASKQ